VKLTLKIMGPNLVQPASIRERNARTLEIANTLKSLAETIASTGALEGMAEFGKLRIIYSTENGK
jgi:hypothetical protein